MFDEAVTAVPIYQSETVVSSTEYKDDVFSSPENKVEKATHGSNGQDLAITSPHYQNISPQYKSQNIVASTWCSLPLLRVQVLIFMILICILTFPLCKLLYSTCRLRAMFV